MVIRLVLMVGLLQSLWAVALFAAGEPAIEAQGERRTTLLAVSPL